MTRARDLAAGTFELATGGVLKLETSDTTVTDGSVLGKIEFKAPDEASGTDANLTAAAIEAVAEGTFAADNNATELVFKTGASAAADAKMIIDSIGNLLVGTTDTSLYNNTSGSGIMLAASGRIDVARVQDVCSILNRTGASDGSIINFAKNGTTVGSIGCSSIGGLEITGNNSGRSLLLTTNFFPANGSGAKSNGVIDLGISDARWKDLYLSGGVLLGGTGAANKLSDYEEGTWTATGNGITLASQESLYVKVGNIVHIGSKIVFPTTSNTSDALISGLPFASVNSEGARAGVTVSWQNEGSSNGLSFLVSPNAAEGLFYLGSTAKSNANMSGHTVFIGGTYLSDN